VYHYLIKPFLFLFKPERAHYLALNLFSIALAIPIVSFLLKRSFVARNQKGCRLAGVDFPNKVGLAAGFDKDGKYMHILSKMGFGFIEIGTVTPLPQSGNPKPRLFRLPKDKALINRMGFNNDGVEKMAERLRAGRPNNVVLGANIGKNKATPNDKAYKDYEICFETLFDLVDYFVVNVSSPNTPGLRELQEKGPLLEILNKVQAINKSKRVPKPLFLKIAPDLSPGQIDDIAEIVLEANISGIVASNTTISRESLVTPSSEIEKIGNGGVSGQPVRARSTEIISLLRQKLGPEKTIIGVGGIASSEDAQEKISAGANLVQVYSGMIYEGPWLIKKINRSLS
jgi:dihydroorotate dehydrogenase